MSAFSDFITEHQDDDVDRLLFSKSKWPDIDMHKAVNTILCRRKLRSKLPGWYANASLVYPARLSAEQCSSEVTAMYKAGLARKLLSGMFPEREEKSWRIADLTGGLGVDSWAFSKIAGRVMYNEMDKALAEAAAHNFKELGASDITIRSKAIAGGLSGQDGISCEPQAEGCASPAELLEGFCPDMIFLDPARRGGDGRKVFLIEDCSPDVLTMKDELLALSPVVMVKLSPMADISMVAERLGRQCKEVHVVSSGGECKELIVVLERDWNEAYTIAAVENPGGGTPLEFTREEEENASAEPVTGILQGDGTYLFEPGKSILKAGAFNLLCKRFGLKKFGRSTHLYLTSDKAAADRVAGLGKIFTVREMLPFNNRNIKAVGCAYPDADVTARNLPVTSDELKSRLYGKASRKGKAAEKKNGGKPDTPAHRHIFAFKSDILGNLLLVAEKG